MQFIMTRSRLVFVMLVIFIATTLAAHPGRNSERSQSADNKASNAKNKDDRLGPIVDYEANNKHSTGGDTKLQVLRRIRGDRYKQRTTQPLGEAEVYSDGYAISTEWEIGLPPLPVSQSDAVILGKVIKAQAYLSNDRTAVYSEFTILPEEIFKTPANKGLTVSEALVAEREGGTVRFQDGRLLPYRIFHQVMPRAGRQYVFFLKTNEQGEDYHIITAYELRHGLVSPLDDLQKFAIYKGFDKEAFLKAVQDAITHSSQQDEKKN